MLLTAAAATIGLYAIFLVPAEDETFVYTNLLIDTLAEEFGKQTGGSKFSSHLPLMPDIKVSPPELVAPLLSTIRNVATEVEPFNVTFAADPLHSFPIWQQGMVAFVDENDELKAAQEKFTHGVEGHSVAPEWKAPAGHPHMPLLFGVLGGNTTALVVDEVKERAPWLLGQRTSLFTAAQLWAIKPMLSEVPSWSLVATVHLGKNAMQKAMMSNSSKASAKKTQKQHEHTTKKHEQPEIVREPTGPPANSSAQRAPHAATAKTQQQKGKPQAVHALPKSAPAAAKARDEEKLVQGHNKTPGGAAAHAGSEVPGAKANADAFAKAIASAHASANAGSGK